MRAIEVNAIGLGGENEIAFSQPVDLVCVDLDVYAPPGQGQIGVMTLFLGHGAHAVDEIESFPEIGEWKRFQEMMAVDHFPVGNLRRKLRERLALKRRHAAPAR